LKTIIGVMLAASAAAAFSMPAAAGGKGAQTFTVHVKSFTSSQPVPALCQGPAGTLTTTVNGVMHVTIDAHGTVSDTFTETGPFTFAPADPSQPTFSGHFETWDGAHGTLTFDSQGNPLNGTTTDHMTINVTGKGSDGTHLSGHINEQAILVWTNGVPAVTVTAFHLTC
jgi:hypothetical protein